MAELPGDARILSRWLEFDEPAIKYGVWVEGGTELVFISGPGTPASDPRTNDDVMYEDGMVMTRGYYFRDDEYMLQLREPYMVLVKKTADEPAVGVKRKRLESYPVTKAMRHVDGTEIIPLKLRTSMTAAEFDAILAASPYGPPAPVNAAGMYADPSLVYSPKYIAMMQDACALLNGTNVYPDAFYKITGKRVCCSRPTAPETADAMRVVVRVSGEVEVCSSRRAPDEMVVAEVEHAVALPASLPLCRRNRELAEVVRFVSFFVRVEDGAGAQGRAFPRVPRETLEARAAIAPWVARTRPYKWTDAHAEALNDDSKLAYPPKVLGERPSPAAMALLCDE